MDEERAGQITAAVNTALMHIAKLDADVSRTPEDSALFTELLFAKVRESLKQGAILCEVAVSDDASLVIDRRVRSVVYGPVLDDLDLLGGVRNGRVHYLRSLAVRIEGLAATEEAQAAAIMAGRPDARPPDPAVADPR